MHKAHNIASLMQINIFLMKKKFEVTYTINGISAFIVQARICVSDGLL